ncbi:hypothetical protein OWS73_15975 [Burkholderia sp. 1B3(2022)]
MKRSVIAANAWRCHAIDLPGPPQSHSRPDTLSWSHPIIPFRYFDGHAPSKSPSGVPAQDPLAAPWTTPRIVGHGQRKISINRP